MYNIIIEIKTYLMEKFEKIFFVIDNEFTLNNEYTQIPASNIEYIIKITKDLKRNTTSLVLKVIKIIRIAITILKGSKVKTSKFGIQIVITYKLPKKAASSIYLTFGFLCKVCVVIKSRNELIARFSIMIISK